MKIKNAIKKWLFKDEMNQFLKYQNSLEELKTKILSELSNYERCYFETKAEMREAKNEYKDTKQMINEIVDVGVDVHMKTSGSWAVLCIDGNPQYMKFVRFERNDIRELQHFLKRFEYSKRVIDAPMLSKDFFINF